MWTDSVPGLFILHNYLENTVSGILSTAVCQAAPFLGQHCSVLPSSSSHRIPDWGGWEGPQIHPDTLRYPRLHKKPKHNIFKPVCLYSPKFFFTDVIKWISSIKIQSKWAAWELPAEQLQWSGSLKFRVWMWVWVSHLNHSHQNLVLALKMSGFLL